MLALTNKLLRSSPAQLSAFALLVAACATAQEPEPGQGTGSGGPTVTAGTGTGGSSQAGSGTSTLPTAGTSVVPSGGSTSPTTGGTPGSGPAPLGGSASSTGGTPAATGGTASTCPQYTGTLAKDSTIFMGGFGQSTTGKWSGYGYTYKYGTATITPGMGTSCFAGAKFCANGSVPAADASGAGLGWNISQVLNSPTTTKVAVTTPVTLKFAGVTAGMRVQLSASTTVSYCYALTDAEIAAGTATIPFASFKIACWGQDGMAYDGVVPIEAIQVAVPGAAAGPKTFDFCLLDIEPG